MSVRAVDEIEIGWCWRRNEGEISPPSSLHPMTAVIQSNNVSIAAISPPSPPPLSCTLSNVSWLKHSTPSRSNKIPYNGDGGSWKRDGILVASMLYNS